VESIEKQVVALTQGSEFGDPQIKEMMIQELRQRLTEAAKEGRPLKVYCGYDVTAPDIHLGHTITMRRLRQFQDFGHEVYFVIGTFTTLIGDPSDRDEERKMPVQEFIEKNAKTYIDQAFKVLDKDKTKVVFNGDWLSKLTFADVIHMASFFTVQQFLNRDRLKNRIEANKPLGLREMLYPLAQGYDAVHLHTDVQLGATEQLFNLMVCRRLQEAYGQKPQVCLTYPVLTGTDGTERMSKSRGNYIGVSEPPEQQYGKIMSIPDSLIIEYFELLTNISAEDLAGFKQDLASNRVNPMELKKRLAREIVGQLHGKEAADGAEEHFKRTVQNKELPDEIDEFRLDADIQVSRLLVEAKKVASRSEANRLIQQGAVSLDGNKIGSPNEIISSAAAKGKVIKVGKRGFIKIT
jgi:tyrosyl-tRNA synthetase